MQCSFATGRRIQLILDYHRDQHERTSFTDDYFDVFYTEGTQIETEVQELRCLLSGAAYELIAANPGGIRYTSVILQARHVYVTLQGASMPRGRDSQLGAQSGQTDWQQAYGISVGENPYLTVLWRPKH